MMIDDHLDSKIVREGLVVAVIDVKKHLVCFFIKVLFLKCLY